VKVFFSTSSARFEDDRVSSRVSSFRFARENENGRSRVNPVANITASNRSLEPSSNVTWSPRADASAGLIRIRPSAAAASKSPPSVAPLVLANARSAGIISA